jgi:predicted 3-demethylubiquinone-9 3-methyltransferase (glyoxalase superfamily)
MTKEDTMHRITPCLWFNDNAEKAVKFYTSIFRNSKITTVTHYDKAGSRASGRPVGTLMTIAFAWADAIRSVGC